MSAVRGFVGQREFVWLDPQGGGWSYGVVATDPVATLTQVPDGAAELRIAGNLVDRDASGWRLLRRAVARCSSRFFPQPAGLNAIGPAWIGYIGYEQARFLERLPASTLLDPPLPTMRLGLYTEFVTIDGATRSVRFDSFPLDWGSADRATPAALGEAAAQRWAVPAFSTSCKSAARWRCDQLRSDVENAVARAIDYIRAGDIYQVNLAHRISISLLDDALEAYAALRAVNPAPFGGVMRWDGGAVLSASPERMLTVRGRALHTTPIKGTRPRTGDPGIDAIAEKELLRSEKDAAELAMIVDLHRNDLGKVSQYGSVHVERKRRVEAHPRVIHTVADVVGTLRRDATSLDVLEACFPAGSITGVPKVRAMEIIDELETYARGAYTGALVKLGPGDDLTAAVGIRLVQIQNDVGYLHVGGGIVAESDPAAEYDETLAKARGILDALVPHTDDKCESRSSL